MAKDYSGVLVFVEQAEGEIHPISFELLNKARELADQIQTPVFAALLGPSEMKVEELVYYGADKVFYLADDIFNKPIEYQYQENLISLIEELKPEIILF